MILTPDRTMRQHARSRDATPTAREKSPPAASGARAARSAAPQAPDRVPEAPLSGGRGLDAGTRALMEARFGHDFSRVRVHDDRSAAAAARSVQARAFAAGSDIVFGTGQYAPGTAEGRRLLAHELAHVVQQSAAGPAGLTDRLNSPGDRFEREARAAADAVMLGRPAAIALAPSPVPRVQRDLLSVNDLEPNDIDPKTAVADPDYVDNGIVSAGLRSNGSVMTPVFTGLTVFYSDGGVMDIPAAANSVFPNFQDPKVPTMTVYRRHKASGKIFPVTILQSDFLAAPGTTAKEMEDAALASSGKFLFRQSTTPSLLLAYTNAVAKVAFAYAGLIGQIWNLGLGITASIQIFTLGGTLRAMAAGRAALGLTGAAAKGAAPQVGTQAVLTAIRTNILKNTLAAAEQATVSRVEGSLIRIIQRAIQNVNAGTATGAWAQRLANTPATSSMYRLTLGNAIHEETFNLIQQEVAAGRLPAGMQTNVGRAVSQAGLSNSFGRMRPDIRLPLSGGEEAVFDVTTVAQAGHAGKYGNFTHVKYVVELMYP
jgi:hypothetical protein